MTFNKFTSHWKSLICGFIPLLFCVKSKCDIYQIHWKMRKNIPYCIRILKGIFVMLHTAVQVPVWCTGQSNILWCLCIMLPEQTSKPIACPKKLLAFASFFLDIFLSFLLFHKNRNEPCYDGCFIHILSMKLSKQYCSFTND